MKKIIMLLLLSVAASLATDIYVFNPTSLPVANQGVSYLHSQDTLKWQGSNNVIFNPTMPTNFVSMTKASNGVVVLLTSNEWFTITNYHATNINAQIKAAAAAGYDALDEIRRTLRAIVTLTVNELNRRGTNPTAVIPAVTENQARTAILNNIAAQP